MKKVGHEALCRVWARERRLAAVLPQVRRVLQRRRGRTGPRRAASRALRPRRRPRRPRRAPTVRRAGKRPNATVVVATIVTVAIVAAAIGVLATTAARSKASRADHHVPVDLGSPRRRPGALRRDAARPRLHAPREGRVPLARPRSRSGSPATTRSSRRRTSARSRTRPRELRALGMVEGNVDLFKQANQLSGDDDRSLLRRHSRRRSSSPERPLDADQRVTLAHELTHTLDDEHFDLDEGQQDRRPARHRRHATRSSRATRGGSRTSTSRQLSHEGRKAYETVAERRRRFRDRRPERRAQDLRAPPAVALRLRAALRRRPARGRRARIASTRRSSRRRSTRNRSSTRSPISTTTSPAPIAAPKLPHGAKKLDGGKEFGALQLVPVLSERIDPHVALKAALGWGADSYTDAREGSKTCVEVRYRGETRTDNARDADRAAPVGRRAAEGHGVREGRSRQHALAALVRPRPEPRRSSPTAASPPISCSLFRDSLHRQIREGAVPTPRVATCAADAVTAQATASDVAKADQPAGPQQRRPPCDRSAQCRATPRTVVHPDEIDN